MPQALHLTIVSTCPLDQQLQSSSRTPSGSQHCFANGKTPPPTMRFTGTSASIISASIKITETQRFLEHLKPARALTVRAPLFQDVHDLTFTLDTPYDEGAFTKAARRAEANRRCKENAVSENYSDCMKRLAE